MDAEDNMDDPFSFVSDRMAIMRGAHKLLTGLGIDPDTEDLVEAARWLAGDDLKTIVVAASADQVEDAEG